MKTADDPNGRVVLGPNEPIFLRRTRGRHLFFFFGGKLREQKYATGEGTRVW